MTTSLTNVFNRSKTMLAEIERDFAGVAVVPPPEFDAFTNRVDVLARLAESPNLKDHERQWVQARAARLARECRDRVTPAVLARLTALGVSTATNAAAAAAQPPLALDGQLTAAHAVLTTADALGRSLDPERVIEKCRDLTGPGASRDRLQATILAMRAMRDALGAVLAADDAARGESGTTDEGTK